MNKHLALITVTEIMLFTLVGCATPPNGTGTNQGTNPMPNTSHANSMKNSIINSSYANTVPSSSNASPSTQQLSFRIREQLLREMSSPEQGETCMNSSCSLSGTNFSGPSMTNQNVVLNMVYMPFKAWYIMVAPTTKNADAIAQKVIKRSMNFPYREGVLVIHSKTVDYYWLSGGKEQSKSEILS